MRTPTWKQLERFCIVEGWEDRDAVRGRPTGDHKRYRLRLPTGNVLMTKVSHGSGQVDANLFRYILRDQLQVTERQFWLAVDKRVPPVREAATVPPEGHRLPASLVEQLFRLGIADEEIRAMSSEQARQRLRDERRRPHRDR